MTYVHVNENGTREIRMSNNNIEHLMVTESSGWPGGSSYSKLTYVVEDKYALLARNIPEG